MPISAWIMFAITALILFGGIVLCLVKMRRKKPKL
ncbi:MAG: MetS family NSS transporter small subunit [candidate division WOR-3 bacterium]|nr:MAG: MetS family NSS transporter small subunit [candidate division WOR-3 bacterium]